jgi:hypothetical protein
LLARFLAAPLLLVEQQAVCLVQAIVVVVVVVVVVVAVLVAVAVAVVVEVVIKSYNKLKRF